MNATRIDFNTQGLDTSLVARGRSSFRPADAPAPTMPPMAVRCITEQDRVEWTNWAGRAPELIHAFGDASSWPNVLARVRSSIATWPGQKLVWALPLATGSQASPPVQTSTPAQFAAGDFDVDFNLILDLILAHNPTGPILIRPGWEAGNFTGWPWGATTSIANARADYIAAFQKAASLIRAKSNRFIVTFCPALANFTNTGAIVDPFDPATGFDPGPAHYDAIGIDPYLVGLDVANGLTFNRMSYKTPHQALHVEDFEFGFRRFVDYAIANDKWLTIDEWGIGADRPDYIRAMARFVANPRHRVLYHGYWNRNAPDGGPPFTFPCRLSDSSNNYPQAKAVFLHEFCGQGRAPREEQAETSAFIARATIPPLEVRRIAYDELFKALRPLIPYLDCLTALCGAEPEISRLNLVGAGAFQPWISGSTFGRVTGRFDIVGAPIFTPDRGWRGTGLVADHLRGQSHNPTTALNRKIAQNDAHMGIWSLTAISNAGAQTYEAGNGNSFIGRVNAGNTWIGRPNTAATVTLSNSGQDAGHIMWNRTAANAWASYFNGAASRNGADASAALSNDDFRIGTASGSNSAFVGVNEIAFFHYGRALPVTANFNGPQLLYTALQAFAQAVRIA